MKRIFKLILVAILLCIWTIMYMTVIIPAWHWIITKEGWEKLLHHNILMKLLRDINYDKHSRDFEEVFDMDNLDPDHF